MIDALFLLFVSLAHGWEYGQGCKWSVGYSVLTFYPARAPASKALVAPWASRALGVSGGVNRKGIRSWSLGKKPLKGVDGTLKEHLIPPKHCNTKLARRQCLKASLVCTIRWLAHCLHDHFQDGSTSMVCSSHWQGWTSLFWVLIAQHPGQYNWSMVGTMANEAMANANNQVAGGC